MVHLARWGRLQRFVILHAVVALLQHAVAELPRPHRAIREVDQRRIILDHIGQLLHRAVVGGEVLTHRHQYLGRIHAHGEDPCSEHIHESLGIVAIVADGDDVQGLGQCDQVLQHHILVYRSPWTYSQPSLLLPQLVELVVGVADETLLGDPRHHIGKELARLGVVCQYGESVEVVALREVAADETYPVVIQIRCTALHLKRVDVVGSDPLLDAVGLPHIEELGHLLTQFLGVLLHLRPLSLVEVRLHGDADVSVDLAPYFGLLQVLVGLLPLVRTA